VPSLAAADPVGRYGTWQRPLAGCAHGRLPDGQTNHGSPRSADAGNYVRGDERVDLLYARRPAARQPLAADGGLEQQPGRPADPFAALDDLMAVVEALCPRWPAREPCEPMPDLRL